MLDFATTWFTPMILILGALHLMGFWILRWWAGRDVRSLAQLLERFTDGIHHRSRLDWRGHLTDQIDAFVTDIREAMRRPEDRQRIRQRMAILDEQRSYLASFRFETAWNVARTGIEIYPLLGVLGTIFALWLAMREPTDDATATVGTIVERFGIAIDSTFAGLAVAILLMVIHSYYETLFARLIENRRAVRELVTEVKRELATSEITADLAVGNETIEGSTP